MKITHFLINSNISIGIAAISLSFATLVQLELPFVGTEFFALIFFASILDYNVHDYLKMISSPYEFQKKKNHLTPNNFHQIKLMIFISLAGFLTALFFTELHLMFFILAVAIPTLFYTIIFTDRKNRFPVKTIPGLKTFLITFIWTTVTVLAPVIQCKSESDLTNTTLVFLERFFFIFAIAIPFDIRDTSHDKITGIKTIPILFGKKKSLLICTTALIISLLIALTHYISLGMYFLLPGYSISILIAIVIINNKLVQKLPFYYHGILDGIIISHGLLTGFSFIFK